MTNKITESAIEKFTGQLLEKQGYQYIYAPDIAPDSQSPGRQSFVFYGDRQSLNRQSLNFLLTL